ncbi:S-layer protein [filamentous cyanobacterium CCT1]|nr:S-layer protein [filamentous cyanobacterium CCT1]PSN79895.1 S-layer protein [filamentous cyanobacterium CCP4]
MNPMSKLKAAALMAATLGVLGGAGQAIAQNRTPVQPMVRETGTLLAQTFGNTDINAANFLVVAVPGSAAQPYRLYIVEQLQPNPPCWTIANPGGEPTQVNALWNTFDFTGICRLQRDTNGYAIRLAGQDLSGTRFEVNQRDGDLLLQFAPSTISRDRITIGRANGISPTGFTQIDLNPGWSLTKRTFNGQIVSSHLVYFTNDLTLAQLQSGETGGGTPPVTPPVTPPTLAFNDIRGNRYAAEITRAATLGVISGFPDNTFKPTSPLTREQAVSVVIETAAEILPTSLIAERSQVVSSPPFPDVAANRWSALKIQQAKQLGLVTGDAGTGNFRPTDNVSRAELMAMMYKLALIRANAGAGDTTSTTPVPGRDQVTGGLIPNIPNPTAFTDISGHWGENAIRQMAAVCAIASPLNETGTNFAPNTNALRDYTAAAAVRAVDCPAARPQ